MRKTLTALLMLISGCQGDPYVDFYTTAKPERNDVVGRYFVKSQTAAPGGLSVLRDSPSVIELRDDGTFTATHVPPRESDPGDEKFYSSLVTCSGTWQIDVIGSIANGGAPPKQHWGVEFKSEECEIRPVGLTGSAAPYGLIITLGDPDAGRVMVFEREK